MVGWLSKIMIVSAHSIYVTDSITNFYFISSFGCWLTLVPPVKPYFLSELPIHSSSTNIQKSGFMDANSYAKKEVVAVEWCWNTVGARILACLRSWEQYIHVPAFLIKADQKSDLQAHKDTKKENNHNPGK